MPIRTQPSARMKQRPPAMKNRAPSRNKATASSLPYKHTHHGGGCIGERPTPHGRVVVVPTGPPPSDMRFLHSGGIRLPICGLGLDAACGVREC